MELTATKDDDLTGVRLQFKLIPGYASTPIEDWEMNERVTLGNVNLYGSEGGTSRDSLSAPGDWDDFAKPAQQAILGPPETPFEIVVQLTASAH